MKRTYEEWLKYYENATKEQVIEDMTHDFEEIEKLKEVINGMIENEEKYCLEINRLNNIINELEKDFERKIQSCTIEAETTTNDFYCRLHIASLEKWLNKIQELKRSDKE